MMLRCKIMARFIKQKASNDVSSSFNRLIPSRIRESAVSHFDITELPIFSGIVSKAKEAAAELNGLYQIYSGRMAKESDEVDVDNTFVAPQELDFLAAAFERIERKKKLMALAQNDEPEKNLKTIATAKITPIHEMVVAMLRYMLTKKEPVSFEELMERANTRSELVASFIALLQLIRKGQVSIISDDPENPLLEINHERDKFTANT